MDRYWTASALIGRLRDEWMVPSILQATTSQSTHGVEDHEQEKQATGAAQQIKQLTDNNTIPAPSRQMSNASLVEHGIAKWHRNQ